MRRVVTDPVTLSGLVCLCWDIFEPEQAWGVPRYRLPLLRDTYMGYSIVLHKSDP